MLSAVISIDYVNIVYTDTGEKFNNLFRAYKAAWDNKETQPPDDGVRPRVPMLV